MWVLITRFGDPHDAGCARRRRRPVRPLHRVRLDPDAGRHPRPGRQGRHLRPRRPRPGRRPRHTRRHPDARRGAARGRARRQGAGLPAAHLAAAGAHHRAHRRLGAAGRPCSSRWAPTAWSGCRSPRCPTGSRKVAPVLAVARRRRHPLGRPGLPRRARPQAAGRLLVGGAHGLRGARPVQRHAHRPAGARCSPTSRTASSPPCSSSSSAGSRSAGAAPTSRPPAPRCARSRPRLGFALVVGLAASLGLPAWPGSGASSSACMPRGHPPPTVPEGLFRALAVVAAVGTVLAAAYALRVLRTVWAGDAHRAAASRTAATASGTSSPCWCVAVLLLGIAPGPLLALTDDTVTHDHRGGAVTATLRAGRRSDQPGHLRLGGPRPGRRPRAGRRARPGRSTPSRPRLVRLHAAVGVLALIAGIAARGARARCARPTTRCARSACQRRTVPASTRPDRSPAPSSSVPLGVGPGRAAARWPGADRATTCAAGRPSSCRCVLAATAGAAGVAAAHDLGSWLVCLELATLPAIALVALRGDGRAGRGALALLTTSLVSFAMVALGAALWLLSTGQAVFAAGGVQDALADPERRRRAAARRRCCCSPGWGSSSASCRSTSGPRRPTPAPPNRSPPSSPRPRRSPPWPPCSCVVAAARRRGSARCWSASASSPPSR